MLAGAHSSHICPCVCSMFLSRDREGAVSQDPFQQPAREAVARSSTLKLHPIRSEASGSQFLAGPAPIGTKLCSLRPSVSGHSLKKILRRYSQ